MSDCLFAIPGMDTNLSNPNTKNSKKTDSILSLTRKSKKMNLDEGKSDDDPTQKAASLYIYDEITPNKESFESYNNRCLIFVKGDFEKMLISFDMRNAIS